MALQDSQLEINKILCKGQRKVWAPYMSKSIMTPVQPDGSEPDTHTHTQNHDILKELTAARTQALGFNMSNPFRRGRGLRPADAFISIKSIHSWLRRWKLRLRSTALHPLFVLSIKMRAQLQRHTHTHKPNRQKKNLNVKAQETKHFILIIKPAKKQEGIFKSFQAQCWICFGKDECFIHGFPPQSHPPPLHRFAVRDTVTPWITQQKHFCFPVWRMQKFQNEHHPAFCRPSAFRMTCRLF